MSNEKSSIRRIGDRAVRLWSQFWTYVEARNQGHVNAWGSTLQYKRRYTNPEGAIAFRTPVEAIRIPRTISKFRT
jgi:hypothetical protein